MRQMESLETRLRDLEKQWRSRKLTLANVSDVESVDLVVAMVSDALRTTGLLDAEPGVPVGLHEIELTLNVAATHQEGGGLKFSVFGVEGDLDGSRRTDDTHMIQISFQPQDLASTGTASGETGNEPNRTLVQRNELVDAFRELKAMIKAERGQAHPRKATVLLNFVVEEDFSVSLVVAGQAETSTTHAVRLCFDQPGATTPVRT